MQIGGILYERGTEPQEPLAPMVVPDIKPYKSMLNGKMITSRSQHREHLKAHGAIEIGNEKLTHKGIPDVAPQQRQELIRAQINDMTNAQFDLARKKDLDNLRWNSRQD